jgi:hypothetical protein
MRITAIQTVQEHEYYNESLREDHIKFMKDRRHICCSKSKHTTKPTATYIRTINLKED